MHFQVRRASSKAASSIDPAADVLRIIALQYNPDTLTRTLQVQGTTGEAGDRSRRCG